MRPSVNTRILVFWLACVMAGTLAPFNFRSPSDHEGLRLFTQSTGVVDVLLNVAIFAPFGALLRHSGHQRSWTMRSILLVTVAACVIVSVIVEFAQAFLPNRDSSVIDVVTNTLGGLFGVAAGRQCERFVQASVARLRAMSPAAVTAMMAAMLVLALLMSAALQVQTRLSNWSTEYPLLVGNEATGDRPWHGRVYGITITDAATSMASIRRFAKGEDVKLGGTEVVRLDLTGNPPYQDYARTLPDLDWTRGVSPRLEDPSPSLRWLQSRGPASRLAQRLRETNAFTLRFQCVTADTDQHGPARIISLSDSPFRRNFTVGQEGRDLVVRLRTPSTGINGYPLELPSPNVFGDGRDQDIIFSYDGATALVAAAGTRTLSRIELTPGSSLALSVPSLQVRADELPLYEVSYLAALSVVPAIVGVLAAHGPRDRLVLGGGWVLAFAVLLELTLLIASGRAFAWESVAVTAGVAAAVVTMFAIILAPPRQQWPASRFPV